MHLVFFYYKNNAVVLGMRRSCIWFSVSATCNTSHYVSLGPIGEQSGLYKAKKTNNRPVANPFDFALSRYWF